MAPDEKPYRVYRGGRVKGKVPSPSERARQGGKKRRPTLRAGGYQTGGGSRWRRMLRRPSWKRIIVLGLIVLLSMFVVWGVASYLALRSGVAEANDKLPDRARAALAEQEGLLLSNGTTILLLGVDSSSAANRAGNQHADSIMLVRTDPSHHRISYLSIPRDLYVPVPGLGDAKINASYQSGGAALAIRTVREYTGVPINHVVVVDFADFAELIDAQGGIEIDVPAPIVSNRFDCPYSAARCANWEGWKFGKGKQTMDGRRALVYARIRENRLDPSENDFTRGARQQAVMQEATGNLTSPSTLAKMPFIGDSLVKPLATDLSTWQLMQLGWVKFRASSGNSLYCRLGGDATYSGGQAVIIPSEDNRNVLAMWQGSSAPQPPTTTYGPGCAKGHPIR